MSGAECQPAFGAGRHHHGGRPVLRQGHGFVGRPLLPRAASPPTSPTAPPAGGSQGEAWKNPGDRLWPIRPDRRAAAAGRAHRRHGDRHFRRAHPQRRQIRLQGLFRRRLPPRRAARRRGGRGADHRHLRRRPQDSPTPSSIWRAKTSPWRRFSPAPTIASTPSTCLKRGVDFQLRDTLESALAFGGAALGELTRRPGSRARSGRGGVRRAISTASPSSRPAAPPPALPAPRPPPLLARASGQARRQVARPDQGKPGNRGHDGPALTKQRRTPVTRGAARQCVSFCA